MTKKGKDKKVAVQCSEEPVRKKNNLPVHKLVISNSLDGFDAELAQLFPLYEQLQLITTELADPELDLLTFAHTAHYFGVLHVEKDVGAMEDAVHQEMTEDYEDEAPPIVEEPIQPTYSDVRPLSIAGKKEKAAAPVEWGTSSSKPVNTPVSTAYFISTTRSAHRASLQPTQVKQEEENCDQVPGPPEWPPYVRFSMFHLLDPDTNIAPAVKRSDSGRGLLCPEPLDVGPSASGLVLFKLPLQHLERQLLRPPMPRHRRLRLLDELPAAK
jgi:hypothetical protein